MALLLLAGCASPQTPRPTPDPGLAAGQEAYAACSDLCVQRGMCREVPASDGHYVQVIHTRGQPGGHGFAPRILNVGAAVHLIESAVNVTADRQDTLAGDTLYRVSSSAWDEGETYWILDYCLSTQPPP